MKNTAIWADKGTERGQCLMLKILYDGPLFGSPVPQDDMILVLHPDDFARLKQMLETEPTRH